MHKWYRDEAEEGWGEFVRSYRRDCPDSAKAVLHELHINDRIEGTTDSKLFPVLRDGTMKWAVLVDHLTPTK